jgi:hypothetical protein
MSFAPLPLYPRRKCPRRPLDMRLGWPQSRSGRCVVKKISCTFWESNPQNAQLWPVPIPTELSRQWCIREMENVNEKSPTGFQVALPAANHKDNKPIAVCKAFRKGRCSTLEHTFLRWYAMGRCGSESPIDMQGSARYVSRANLKLSISLCFQYNIQLGWGDYPSCYSAWLTGLSVRVAALPKFLRQHGDSTLFWLRYSLFVRQYWDYALFWLVQSVSKTVLRLRVIMTQIQSVSKTTWRLHVILTEVQSVSKTVLRLRVIMTQIQSVSKTTWRLLVILTGTVCF